MIGRSLGITHGECLIGSGQVIRLNGISKSQVAWFAACANLQFSLVAFIICATTIGCDISRPLE